MLYFSHISLYIIVYVDIFYPCTLVLSAATHIYNSAALMSGHDGLVLTEIRACVGQCCVVNI